MLVLAIAQAALAGFTALVGFAPSATAASLDSSIGSRHIVWIASPLVFAWVMTLRLVGAFADGGDIWSRLLLILVHPLCAAGLLLLVLLPRPATAIVLAIAALLVVNVGADLFAALMIARGAVRGDWFLPAIFSVIPAIGVVYALTLARMRPRPDDG